MINLIPPAKRRELRAMRHNTILVRYVLISIVFFAATLFIHFGTFLLLKQAEVSNTAQSQSHEQKASEFTVTYDNAREYTMNLAAARQLFDNSVPYPDALSNLANILPEGVIIDTVNLEAAIIDQPGTLMAHATSYESAVALKDAFTNSEIAENVSIASVNNTAIASASETNRSNSASPEQNAPSNYPIQVTLNITFTRFLLYPPSATAEDNAPSQASTPDITSQPEVLPRQNSDLEGDQSQPEGNVRDSETDPSANRTERNR